MSKNNNLAIPISIVIAGAIIATGIFAGNFFNPASNDGTAKNDNEPTIAGANTAENIVPVSDSDHIRGSKDAKIKIVEFSDLDCPFCSQVHKTLKQITTEYSNEDVAWVYRHFPLEQLHPNAYMKAVASECVSELEGNDAFWKFVDLYSENQSAAAGIDEVVALGEDLGFDSEAFETCIVNNEYEEIVDKNIEDGFKSGARGTPYNVIISENEILPINGAAPYENFKTEIDRILENL